MGGTPKSKRYVERYDADKDGDESVTGDLFVAGNLTVTGNVTISGTVISTPNLPTSDPLVAGQLWSNLGVVTVSSGS
jgi:hypothetical protein